MTGAGQPVRRVTPRLRRARIAVGAVFFVHGAVFASWAARVPAVRDGLHLSTGQLGLVLAGPGLGALAGSQAGGLLTGRYGGRAVSASAPLVLCLPLALIPLATSPWSLTGLLLLLGAADGATSVAMNAQAVTVQHHYGRSVLNGMHAVRSLGAVAGGLAGVATTAAGMTVRWQFLSSAAVLAVVSAVAARGLLSDGAGRGRPHPAPAPGLEPAPEASPSGRVLAVALLALMTFLAALVEDAPASWSGVWLRQTGAGPATAAAGYAAFCAGQVLARGVNDRLVNRLGWTWLIRTGALVCAAALTVALLTGLPWVTLAALVVAGGGISVVFPGAFATAGALPGAARAMGQVGFAGNLGWLLVSPLIGAAATAFGLPTALGLLVVAAVSIAALAAPARRGTVSRSRRAVPDS